jgi:DNA processing protein
MKIEIETLTTIAENLKLDLDPDTIARAMWSMITEPQDDTAGPLIHAFGAVRALEQLLDKGARIVEGIALDPLRERALPRMNSNSFEVTLRAAARFGVQLIGPTSPDWPQGFDDLGTQTPHLLWVRGNTKLLNSGTHTAIVGARAATGYGEHVAMEMTAGLVERGHTITSGAAYGIDGMAHRSALASSGNTIAYLAGGVDRFYPSGHDALLAHIVEKGAVASEIPVSSPPTKWRLLARNRLIAASTKATVVVEAGWRSGSLNIAGHAVAVGRPVGAVPGPVTSAASAGCHRLIRDQGVTLVTNADEAAAL